MNDYLLLYIVGEYIGSACSIGDQPTYGYGKSRDSSGNSTSSKRVQSAVRRVNKNKLGKTQVVRILI